MNVFSNFIELVKEKATIENRIHAVCIAGSYLSDEIDEFSDLDFLIIVDDDSTFKFSDMVDFAESFGHLLAKFTGDHVGEDRLLICLYETPFLHVDFKFIKLNDFYDRIENPQIIYSKNSLLDDILLNSQPNWPYPNFQWIEDRFWVWIHYASTKLGRGEFFEAIELISFLRNTVLGPFLHIKYDTKPRGVRKLEFILDKDDLDKLVDTLPLFDFESIKKSILACVEIYQNLRESLYFNNVNLSVDAEIKSIEYLNSLNK